MKESKKIEEFLNYSVGNELTRKNYQSRLKVYYKIVGRNPDAYMKNIEMHKKDMMKFLDSDYRINAPKLTVKATLNAVVQLIKNNDVILPNSFLKMVSSKTIHAKPITRSEFIEQEQLKTIILSGDTIERAAFSMLSSSGMRIGEFSLLELSDIDLKTKPTTIHVRAETAKSEKERWCFIDKIATNYLKKYLDKRDYYFKELDKYHYKREINENLLFPISSHAIRRKWEKLLRRNGLSEKDVNTGREVRGIHGLRKNWKTIMKQHMPDGIVNAIIGHSSYLGTYEIYPLNVLRDAYRDAENYISFEPKTVDKKEINGLMKEKDAQIKILRDLLIAKTEYEDEQREKPIMKMETDKDGRPIAVPYSNKIDAHDKVGDVYYRHTRKMSDKEKKYRRLLEELKEK